MQHPNGPASRTPIANVPQLAFSHAVQFGQGARSNDVKGFPFFYNFVKYPYQEGAQNDTTGIYSITGESAEGPDGILIPAGGILNIPIVLHEDFPFHLLYLKYGAHFELAFSGSLTQASGEIAIRQPTNGYTIPANTPIRFTSLADAFSSMLDLGVTYYVVNGGPAGYFWLSLTVGGAALTTNDASLEGAAYAFIIVDLNFGSREYISYYPDATQVLLNAQRNTRIPYWTELDVSLYFPSSGGRDLYGGFQRAPQLGATEEQPLPLLDLQGNQDGHASLRTPYQLPASAHVDIRIRSRSAYPLRVYGHLFGYKITI